jgi:hypothetical protein
MQGIQLDQTVEAVENEFKSTYKYDNDGQYAGAFSSVLPFAWSFYCLFVKNFLNSNRYIPPTRART